MGLAVLMGSGGILFGVGGTFGGGVANIFSGNEGTSSASFTSQVEHAQKRTKSEPNSAAAWAALTEAQLHKAGEHQYYSESEAENEHYTAKGKEFLSKVSQSWSKYHTLEPHNPSPALAKAMLRVYSEEGLDQPSAAAEVLQIIIQAEPHSSSWYSQLALYSYKANNPREGDLASRKAVSLAPASDRKTLKQKLEEIKKNPTGSSNATGASAATSTSGAASGATGTATIGGKTYPIHLGSGSTTTKK